MRSIHKQAEPAFWRRFRAIPGAAYDDVNAPKDELREAIVREQGGLCCYCMRRARPDRGAMRIEHWAPREKSGRVLEYANLLAACLGGEGQRDEDHHCDVAKSDRLISVHPAEPSHQCSERFVYSSDGTISGRDGDRQLQADIATLNLNYARARAGRRAMISAIHREVARTGPRVAATRLKRLVAELERPNGAGQLLPFCQAGIFWLKRQIRKR